MGSFLMKCGVSNRVLQENDPIILMFISKPILSGGKIKEDDCFVDWRPESLLIPGIQDDYGYVNVDIKYKDTLAKIMLMLYENSVEPDSDNSSHPTWKQYFIKNIEDPKLFLSMKPDDIFEHFNELVSILHNKGIAYISRVHNVTSIMKLCHVDKNVFDCIEKAPALIDHFRLEYNNDANINYNLDTVANFDDYLKYLIAVNLKRYQRSLSSKYVDLSDLLSFNSAYDNYYELFSSVDYQVNFKTVDEIIDFVIYKRKEKHLIDYAHILGVKFSPSIYGSQDYDEYASRNNRNLMKMVFNKQQEIYLKNNQEGNYQNGIDFRGNPIPEDMTHDDYIKICCNPENIKEILKEPEVIATEKNNIINPELVGYDMLVKQKAPTDIVSKKPT